MEDSAVVFRQRLLSALVIPGAVEGYSYSDFSLRRDLGMAKRPAPTTENLHVLDVASLSLEQRVLVQLHGVGLVGSCNSSHSQV